VMRGVKLDQTYSGTTMKKTTSLEPQKARKLAAQFNAMAR